MGVASMALFGSVARDEAVETSDVDILVTFSRPVSLFDFVDIQLYIQKILGVASVDLVMRDTVIEELKEIIYEQAVPCL